MSDSISQYAIYAQADQLLAEGHKDEARALLEELRAQGSQIWEVYNDLGVIYSNEGNYESAIASLNLATTLEFSSTHSLRNLIRAHAAAGEYGAAFSALAHFGKLNPADPTLQEITLELITTVPAKTDDLTWLSPEIAAMKAELASIKQKEDSKKHFCPYPHPSESGEKAKVFCIGRNKTGTTSLEAALKHLGYRLGCQLSGEMLKSDWQKRDFSKILALCTTADAFQDIPFSYPYTFQAVDMAFPGSKFILTIRDSPEQWYSSVIRYQTKLIGKGRPPTAADLKEFTYRYKGFLWESAQMLYGIDETTLYDKDIYISHYNNHNKQVIEYFKYRPADLLVLNVANPDSMERLCTFLSTPSTGVTMPHLNISDDINMTKISESSQTRQ